MTHLMSDLRFAWRGLRKAPVFTTVAVLSIALGIGANTAIFTLVDQVLLRLLPVKDPQQLVWLRAEGRNFGNVRGEGQELSYPMFVDLRDNNAVFDGVFCRLSLAVHVSIAGRTERVQGELVSGAYFPTLGVGARLGRTFGPDEDRMPGGHPVAVLSHAYWKSRFASDPAIVGQPILVSNTPMTIVGVAQEGFDGVNQGTAAQVYVPMMMAGQLTEIRDALTDRRTRWLNVFGRLRPGVTPERARAALQPFYASRLQMESEQPAFARFSAADKAQFLKGYVTVTQAAHGKSDLRQTLQRPLIVLMTIVACVLLIACANVANLLLARASARQREIAVRLALGATRQRVVQQLLVESLLLACAGGVAGLLLATWGASVLLGFYSNPDTTLTIATTPDLRVLGFTLAVSIVTGLIFGLVPARRATQPALAPTLKNEAGSVVGGTHVRLRKALVVSQVALSLLLLIGAGLFLRSLRNLTTLDAGLDASRVISFTVDLMLNGYRGERSKQFGKTLLERVQTTPGVEVAGFAEIGVLQDSAWSSGLSIEGVPNASTASLQVYNNVITPGYFPTLGMKIVAGRDFDARDERIGPVSQSTPATVAIVNQTFVTRFLGGRSPLGLHIGIGRNASTLPTEIVGVVSDAKYMGLKEQTRPQLFIPYLAGPRVGELTMYVKTTHEPEAMFATLRGIVRQLDPNVPLYDVQTFDERVARSISNERLVASLSTAFGVLATLLAMIGLYGVMAYTVARRTREIGIRIALGAVSGHVTWMILREVAILVGLGLAIGLPAALGLSRYVSSQLFGVLPTDLTTIVVATLMLTGIAALAGLVPARRAARINPITALRYD